MSVPSAGVKRNVTARKSSKFSPQMVNQSSPIVVVATTSRVAPAISCVRYFRFVPNPRRVQLPWSRRALIWTCGDNDAS